VRTGWYSVRIYTARGSVGRWSGPIRSRGRVGVGVVGVKEACRHGGEYISLYEPLEALNCCFFTLRRCIRGL